MKLVASNRMERLAKELQDFFASTVSNPLESEVVIVQSKGMATWLKQTLASEQGICANVDFVYPRDFIARVFREFLGPEDADWRTWRDDRLLWRVMSALPELLDHPAFTRVRGFLGTDLQSAESQHRLYQLASRVAILFDRYQNYRPEMIEEWTEHPGDTWSGVLFHQLTSSSKEPHLPQLARTWMAKGTGAHLPRSFPKRVALFGLATMPPMHLTLLENLANHRGIELRLFHLNPSRQYWADIRSKKEILHHLEREQRPDEVADSFEEGHPLLATLGQVGRDFQGMLIEQVESVSDSDFVPHDSGYPSTILGRLQEDIDLLRQLNPGDAKLHASEDDNSLCLRSCDGPLRQVEVLRDDLLTRLSDDPTLNLRDIVVMCPDLETFAPLIEAVFDRPVGSAGEGLSYRIADRDAPSENPVARAFNTVLNLIGGRFEASQVLDLLGHEPIRRASTIPQEDVERVMRWVRESGIRWGIDGKHRARFGLPALEENSWRFGLKRMLLGTAMPEELEQCFSTILPYDAAYGLNAAGVGRFVAFCELLFEADTKLHHPRTLAEWFHDLAGYLDRLCTVSDQDAWQSMAITRALSDLAEHAEEAGFDGVVPLSVAREALASRLGTEPSTRGFLAGGITFCRMLPMRSIPFRVVALLGMDEGVFPRRGERLDFDLMRSSPKPGDRSARLDDRQIFLEAILSARDALTITFNGRNASDQSRLSPSVVVCELIDAIAETYDFPDAKGETASERAFDALTSEHALQPFSPRNFSDDAPLRSYETTYAKGAEVLQAPPSTASPFFGQKLDAYEREQITPAELATFFKNPIQTLLRERLALNLRHSFERPSDRESIVLDALERYAVRDKLLRSFVEKKPPKAIRTNLHAAGMLAPGHLGDDAFHKLAVEVEPMAAAVRSRTPPQGLQTLRVDLEIGGIRLRGPIANVGLEGLVYGHAGTTRAKHRLDTWIHHLLLTLVRQRKQVSWIFGKSETKKKKRLAERLGHVTDPLAHLESLVSLYRYGMQQPLAFMPATSETFFKHSDSPDKAWSKARKTWEPTSFNAATAEGADPSAQLVFGSEFPFGLEGASTEPSSQEMAFESVALEVFAPLHDALQEVEL